MYKNKMLIYGIALVENGKVVNYTGHSYDFKTKERLFYDGGLGKYDNLDDILGKEINCPICGEDILVTEDNLIPVFSFDENYRNEQKNLLTNKPKKKLAQIFLKEKIIILFHLVN